MVSKAWLAGLDPTAGPGKRRATTTNKPAKPLTPEQRIKELERQIKDEQLKSARFEKVVDIMRDEHGVTVKKPAGMHWQSASTASSRGSSSSTALKVCNKQQRWWRNRFVFITRNDHIRP